MADTKITDLTAITGASLASTDLAVVVDVSDTTMAASGTDKKTTVADLATAVTTVGALATSAAVAAGYQPLDADLTAIAAISPAQGDVIYHNGTGWTKLAAGTSGHYLKTQGAGANPTWAAAGGSVAALTDVDLTGLTGGDSLVYDNGTTTWVPATTVNVTAGTPAAGDALVYDTGTSTYGPGTPRSKIAHTFSVNGTVAVATGGHRLYAEETLTIESVRASVGTAPTGASLLVDVNKNGTTIFTTQTNRPTITASGFTDLANAIEVSSLALGDYLTVDVDQVGSTVAGADLTVTIVLRRG